MGDQNGFEEWNGYMNAKKTKLEEQYTAASAPFRKSKLFEGISIYVNGLTNPSSDELKRIMMIHGGIYHHYQRQYTSYVIASNLPDVKVRNMDTSKIISAQWVVDCLAANRLLDHTAYLLYTNQKTTQPRLNFGKAKKEQSVGNSENDTIDEKSEDLNTIMQDLEKLNEQMRVDKTEQQNTETTDMESKQSNIRVKTSPSSSSSTSNSARTAVDPNFLLEFFNNSRLHHIATLGAGFKQYVSELREKHNESIGFPARLKLLELIESEGFGIDFVPPAGAKYVMHIDMDCFFVSVGLRKYPQLRGQPVAVTHSKGGSSASEVPVHPDANREVEMELFAKRFEQHLHNNILSDKVRNGFDAKMSLSEIASCSYEAREKGIRNGMFVGQAIKLCPELKTIPYDFDGYKEVAFALYDTIAQYTLQIEAVSCDEMFVELSDLVRELKVSPMAFVSAIRAEVRQKTGCPCSAGVGANKLQARMATKWAKPDGQYHLEVNDVKSYMENILAEELPGVGSSTNYILKEAGYITCGDLQRLTLARLQGLVGKKHGETLYQFCRGIDNRPLSFEQIRKSVSAEVNYGIRFKDYIEVETFLSQLCGEVHSRLIQLNRKTKCITLKVMVRAKDAPVETSKFMGHGVCDNITKSVALTEFTNDLGVITGSVLLTMKNLKLPPNDLRGIGIQLTKLDEPKMAREPKENLIKNMFKKLSEKQKEEDKAAQMHQSEAVRIINPSLATAKQRESLPEYVEIEIFPSAKTAQPKKRPNVIDMLKDAYVKKQKTLNENPADKSEEIVLPNDIDREVFEALPPEIREEILQEIIEKQALPPTPNRYKIITSGASSSSSQSFDVVVNDNSDVDPLDQPSTSRAAYERRQAENNLRQQASSKLSAGQAPSGNNIFLRPNCNQLLLSWVKSDLTPRDYDIFLCREQACEMVRAKQLSLVYTPLNYLRKIIESIYTLNDNPWFRAYCDILKAVHREVNSIYEGRMLYTRDINLM